MQAQNYNFLIARQQLFKLLFQRDICSMEGALPFLVGLLNHRSLDIVENSSGILRNMSSYIVTCDEAEIYRYVSALMCRGIA